MRKFSLFAVTLMMAVTVESLATDVTSPDGRLVVSVNPEEPSFSVSYNGNVMLEDSPLGLLADLNATDARMSLKLDLSFLSDGQVTRITDDAELNPVRDELKLKTKKPFPFELAPSGATILISDK